MDTSMNDQTYVTMLDLQPGDLYYFVISNIEAAWGTEVRLLVYSTEVGYGYLTVDNKFLEYTWPRDKRQLDKTMYVKIR